MNVFTPCLFLLFIHSTWALSCYQNANTTFDYSTTVNCSDSCFDFQLHIKDNTEETMPLFKDHWTVQGCGSGELNVGGLVPENLAEHYVRDANFTIGNVCQSLSLNDSETPCNNDTEAILKHFLSAELERKYLDLILDYVGTVRLCCCYSDQCNDEQHNVANRKIDWRDDDEEKEQTTKVTSPPKSASSTVFVNYYLLVLVSVITFVISQLS